MYKGLWNKIRNVIISKNNNSENYHEKYLKIKFNSDDNLTLKKTQQGTMVIDARSVFHEDNK